MTYHLFTWSPEKSSIFKVSEILKHWFIMLKMNVICYMLGLYFVKRGNIRMTINSLIYFLIFQYLLIIIKLYGLKIFYYFCFWTSFDWRSLYIPNTFLLKFLNILLWWFRSRQIILSRFLMKHFRFEFPKISEQMTDRWR